MRACQIMGFDQELVPLSQIILSRDAGDLLSLHPSLPYQYLHVLQMCILIVYPSILLQIRVSKKAIFTQPLRLPSAATYRSLLLS